MPGAQVSAIAAPSPLGRWLEVVFRLVLSAALLLAPAVFARFHRFGPFSLLFLVGLLHAFWVVRGVLGTVVWHRRSWAHLAVWGLLALVLFQMLPLPLGGWAGRAAGAPEPAAGLIVEPARAAEAAHSRLPVWLGRFSLRPGPTSGVLLAGAGAAGLYWLVASAVPGRRGLRWVTWPVVFGFGLLAYLVLVSRVGAGAAGGRPGRLLGPVLVLGGDSPVPALLVGLSVAVMVLLRHLGRMLPAGWGTRGETQRGRLWRWIGRGAGVRAVLAAGVVGLAAGALGVCNVPRGMGVACVGVAAGAPLLGYLLRGAGERFPSRPAGRAGFRVGVVLTVGLLVAVGLWFGTAWAGPAVPATSADGALRATVEAMPGLRRALGLGAGVLSPRAVFGRAGWPAAAGDDVDADGFLLARIEVGWLGLALGLLAAVALAVGALRRPRGWGRPGPWALLAGPAAVGIVGANLLYFRLDASALLVPNLIASAAGLGLVSAWLGHGAIWRTGYRDGETRVPAAMAESRWPLVAAAVGLLAAFGLAETQMLRAGGGGLDSDKALHFGTFAVLSLLLCYAVGPTPDTRRLGLRLMAALVLTVGLGATVEVGQALLTEGRQFEWLDMGANGLGALLMVGLWWVVRRGQWAGAGQVLSDESPPRRASRCRECGSAATANASGHLSDEA